MKMPANPLGGTGGHSSESLRRRGAAGSIPAGRVTPPQRIEYRLAQRRRRVAADREADRPVTAVQPLVETASITASIHHARRERNAIPVREEKGGTGLVLELQDVELAVSRPSVDAEIAVERRDARFRGNLGAADQACVRKRDGTVGVLLQQRFERRPMLVYGYPDLIYTARAERQDF